jgi:hypothetical protein
MGGDRLPDGSGDAGRGGGLRWGRVIGRGALELAYTVAYRAAKLREFSWPEYNQNDNQDNDQMDRLECSHGSDYRRSFGVKEISDWRPVGHAAEFFRTSTCSRLTCWQAGVRAK